MITRLPSRNENAEVPEFPVSGVLYETPKHNLKVKGVFQTDAIRILIMLMFKNTPTNENLFSFQSSNEFGNFEVRILIPWLRPAYFTRCGYINTYTLNESIFRTGTSALYNVYVI